MADTDFKIGVNTSDAIRSLNSLNSALGNVTNAFRLTIAGISVGAIVKFSDQVTNLKNKLMLLSDSQEQANAQFKALAAISIAARSDLSATGDLYFRIARSVKDLGVSQSEAAQITESLAKAMTASGLSAAESAGPLLQLGQALQSGRFQGDELRSVLEGMPPVAKALADSLGVPIGALRSMGANGQITAQVFVEAMRKARDSIERDFAKTIPTIGQAFNELKTSAALAFNDFEKNSQTGQNFAYSIEYLGFVVYKLSKNIDDIIGPLGTFIKIAGSLWAFTAAGKILSTFGSVIMVLVRGIGMFGTNVAMVMERIAQFGVTMRAAGGGLLAFAETAIFTLLPIGRLAKAILTIGAAVGTFIGLDKLGDWFKSLGNSNSESRNELEDYRKELQKFKGDLSTTASAPAPVFLDPEKMRKAKNDLDKIVNSYAMQNAQLENRLKFEQALIGVTDQQKTVRQALFDLESNYLSEVNKLMDDYREKSTSKNAEDQAQLPLIQQAIVRVTESYQNQIDKVKNLTEENYKLNEAEKQRLALSEFAIKTVIDGNKQLRDIQADIAKTTMSEIQKKYYDIARAAEESARSAIDSENARRRQLKLTQMSKQEEQAYYDAAKKQVEELQAAEQKRYDESRKFSTGWKNAFQQYADDATNAAKQAEMIFQKATQGMEDMIVNFAKTGKFEWKNFINSMLEDLLRSQIRQVMAQIFSIPTAGGGTAGGSLFGSIGNLLGFANGGIIPTNQPVLVGERGPELLVGASGGRVVPNSQMGSTGNVTYNINAVDAMSFKQMIAQDPSFIHAVAMQGSRATPGRR